MQGIKPGLVGESEQVVTEGLTARSLGSGLVPAFATPAMIALLENASVNAIRKYLQSGHTSVGVEVNIRHLAATPVGMNVHARAEVLSVDKHRVTFQVEAWDDKERIGEGTHVRVVVDEARFKERIARKRADQGDSEEAGKSRWASCWFLCVGHLASEFEPQIHCVRCAH
jgi:predicted thioesterase